ncbi:hypothetical protein PSN01_05337 [Micromonospora saelicesensis]|nr:hypothetical protein PSN01_05337 [Micromonospora saelicesensis]
MFRKDTARFRKVSGQVDGPRPLAPHRNSTGFRRRRRRRRRRTGSRQVRADGAGRQGRVGVSTLPPPHPAGRGIGMPRPGVSGRRAHRNTYRTTPRRESASGCGTGGGGGGRCHQVLRRSPVVAVLRCGRGIPVRSHRTTVLLVRHRAVGPGCTLSDADLCPGHGAQSVAGPSPVGFGKPVGRWRCEHRRRGWSMVRRPPRSASVPPRPTRSRAPPSGPPRPAPAGPATRRRRRESGRHRWRPPR